MGKKDSLNGKQPPANRGGVTPTAIAAAPIADAHEVDPVKSFMQKNPKGTFPADTESEVIGTLSSIPTEAEIAAEAPAAAVSDDQPALDSQGEPVAVAEGDKPADAPVPAVAAEVKPADAKPVEAKPVVAETKPVEPAAPSYAPAEKIHLAEGNEPWTREQIVLGLQERATLQPKAAEADQFRSMFGADFEATKKQWEEPLKILRENPTKNQLASLALQADPELVDYLLRSAEYFQSAEGVEARGGQPSATTVQPKSPVQPAALDPRVDAGLKWIEDAKRNAMVNRANTEWSDAYTKYPYLHTDLAAREALKDTAMLLFNADRAAGKEEWECRGLLDAMKMNATLLDARKIAATAGAAPAALAPTPNVEPQALLGSSGTGPSVARSEKITDYTGNPEDAVAAFTKLYPRS